MVGKMIEFGEPIFITCRGCGSESVIVRSTFFHGMHTLSDCLCKGCGQEFYQTLPIGHDLDFPIQFSKDGRQAYFDPKARDWLALPLIRSFKSKHEITPDFSKVVKYQCSEAVLVNCLDNCFGHVFTKIWNAITLAESEPKRGIIMLIPAQCAWLLPDHFAEAWLVHLPLNSLDKKIVGLDDFIKDQIKNFESFFLSQTFTYLDHHVYLDFEKIFKIPRFDLNKFSRNPPTFTFVLREDRFWHNSTYIDFLYRFSIKFRLKAFFKPFFLWRQSRLVNRTANLILIQIPGANFYAVGLGKSGKLSNKFMDLRQIDIDVETERKWNNCYAKSHIVIGVHGSNMLIPSGLAAGFINIVPRFKIDQFAEDSILPYSNRMLQFLGRFVDEYSSPKLIAMHAISMIRQFPFVQKSITQKPE